TGVADGTRQQDVRRRITARPAEFAEHTTDVRMLDPALEEASGLHHLVAGIVDGGRFVVERADERELVGVLGHAWEDLTDLDARHIGFDRPIWPANLSGRTRLQIPGVELTWAAHQKEHDAIHLRLSLEGAFGLESEEVCQRQAEKGERSRMQKV